MVEKNVKKIGWLIIVVVIVIFFVGLFIYNNNNEENNEIMQNEIKQESIEDSKDNQETLISEEDMLDLFSESSDIRVTSINKYSEDRFVINAKYYSRVKISPVEFDEMKNNSQIIIDGITYTYETSKEYSSFGIIKSTQDSSKKYYLDKVDNEYHIQSIYNGGYDDPLTEFNKEFQYEVDQNYMIRILDLNGIELSYVSLKEFDSNLINSSFEEMQATISRGPQGIGSEIIFYKK